MLVLRSIVRSQCTCHKLGWENVLKLRCWHAGASSFTEACQVVNACSIANLEFTG